MTEKRKEGRLPDQLRRVKITRRINKFAAGSALIETGDTKVLCSISFEDRVPLFLRDSGQGWLTAEYGMLPSATPERSDRANYTSGRSREIQRLIGRSLRSVLNLKHLGERMILVDCDVLQADGGTRTAAINGSFIALVDALVSLRKQTFLRMPLLKYQLAATSVGIVGGKHYLDLDYQEDSSAGVDFNVVMTSTDEFIELQGTGEGVSFSRRDLDLLLTLAKKGSNELFTLQREISGDDLAYLLGK
jgi:ribonuclease PH